MFVLPHQILARRGGVENTVATVAVFKAIPPVVPTWTTTFGGSIHEWWGVICPNGARKNSFVVLVVVEDPLMIFIWVLD